MRMFLLLTLFSLLTGCGTIGPKYSKLDVKNTEVIQITIPDNLLTLCNPDKPISKDEYLSLDLWEREQYMTEYSISLLKLLKECNIKIEKIRELNSLYVDKK